MLRENCGGQMCMSITPLLSTAYATPSLASLKGLNLYSPAKPTWRTTCNHSTEIGVRLGMELPSFWKMLGCVRRSRVSISHNLLLILFLILLKPTVLLSLCAAQSIPIQLIPFLMTTTEQKLKCFVLGRLYLIQQLYNVTSSIYISICQPLLWIILW